jgi:F-type H+-transporting ATPase subunit gamma
MSKLIQLRQRIKAIETIKKITHAMRLIAMSAHSQLKNSQPTITSYTHELESIFNQLRMHAPEWSHSVLQPNTKTSHKIALVLVGSQKGLCGSFNNNLFKMAHKTIARLEGQEIDIIPVGQKAIDFAEQLSVGQIKHSYKKFSIRLISDIADEIAHSIFHASPTYKSVLIVSNRFKNFFMQFPKSTQIIPEQNSLPTEREQESDLIWDQSAEKSLNDLAFSYITARIQLLLFDSLLSEHAARFVSMDGSTRNANGILESTKLEYNKLRQAKITKELTELTGSY